MLLLVLGLLLSLSGVLVNLLVVFWIELLVVFLVLVGSLLLWVFGLGEGLFCVVGVLLDLLFCVFGLLVGLVEVW